MQCLTQHVFCYLDSIEALKEPYSTLFVRSWKTAHVWVPQNRWADTFINWFATNDSYRRLPSPLKNRLLWALLELSLTYEYMTILISISISWFPFDTFLSPLFHCVFIWHSPMIFTAAWLMAPLLQTGDLLPRKWMQNVECQPTVYPRLYSRNFGFVWSVCWQHDLVYWPDWAEIE